MSRKKWLWGVAMLCAVLLWACGGEQQEQAAEEADEAAGVPATDPLQYAATLWKSDISWYGTWDLLPGTEEMGQSRGNPHGMYGSDYGNTMAVAAATGDIGRMPEGAIIVRENYNREHELIRITTVSKTNNKWFWTVYNPDGTVELAGELNNCIECHSESERDMLFFWTNINDTE